MSSILSAFCRLNQVYQLISTDQKILLAVSGGVDSLGMAILLREYQRASGTNLDFQQSLQLAINHWNQLAV